MQTLIFAFEMYWPLIGKWNLFFRWSHGINDKHFYGLVHVLQFRFSLHLETTIWNKHERIYKGSPDSTNFAHPRNHTIEKIVLTGDWFNTKIAKCDFGFPKSPFFLIFTKFIEFSLYFKDDNENICHWNYFQIPGAL